jgi:hypothetical protein
MDMLYYSYEASNMIEEVSTISSSTIEFGNAVSIITIGSILYLLLLLVITFISKKK